MSSTHSKPRFSLLHLRCWIVGSHDTVVRRYRRGTHYDYCHRCRTWVEVPK